MGADAGCLDDTDIFGLVCGQLSGVRVAEVDAHVDSCATCREIVLASARSMSKMVELRAGASVGRYLIVEEIGRGGFGVVYRAYDTSLDRAVALKWLRTSADASWRERLWREAKAMARLSHPNVVTVYEVGEAAGATFIAMELVEGLTLRAWLAAERRSRAAVLAVLLQAGEGLAAAHAAGLVHRDFKPENVLVGRDGRARVTDFGLARGDGEPIAAALGELSAEELEANITMTGALLGTPAYMAPEQLRGEAADRLSDQWSFAVAAWEALTGARPFGGASLAELESSLAAGAPKAGGFSERALGRALARAPKQRYPDMRALLGAMTRDPRARWRSRIAVAAAVLAVAAVATYELAPLRRPCAAGEDLAAEVWNDERAGALERAFSASGASYAEASLRTVRAALGGWREAWTSAYTDACEDSRVRASQSDQALDARMTCLERQRVETKSLIDALAHADAASVAEGPGAVGALGDVSACSDVASLTSVAAPSPDSHDAVAKLDARVAAAKVLATTGRHAEAVREGRLLVSEAEAIAYDPLRATAELVLADALVRTSDLAGAEEHALAGLWAAERAADQPQVVRAWLALAAVAGSRGRYPEAERACRHAEAALAHIEAPALRAQLDHALGVVHTNLGDYPAAERELGAALEARVRLLGDEHLDVARTYTSLGNLARAKGDAALAEKHHSRAREIDRQLLGASHPNEARHLHNLARVRLLQGDRAAAQRDYEAALALKRATLGDRHPEVAISENSLGLLFLEAGELAPARQHFEAALAILSGTTNVESATTLYNLGLLLDRQGDRDAALARLEEARDLFTTLVGAQHARVVEVELAVGDVQRGRGDAGAALAAYRRAQAIAGRLPGGAALRARADERIAAATPAPQPPPPTQRTSAPLPRPAPPPAPRPAPPPPQPGGSYMPGQTWD
jgi:eukaryotic-like serine/threonine-protein kinase